LIATSQSNESTQNYFYADTKIVCVPDEILKSSLSSYGEQPMLSLSSRRIAQSNDNRENREYPSVLFGNASTGSWTLVERQGEDIYCIIGVGENLKPHR
jgi:hypothetical protein